MLNNFADVNGTKFYEQIAGQGHPRVLVHAGIADRGVWEDQSHVLEYSYRVLRDGWRGFGNTGMVAVNYSYHRDLCCLCF